MEIIMDDKQYYNLVFVNHGTDKNYLFQVPSMIRLKKGEKVFVDTSQGECIGTCVSNSFIVGEYETDCIVVATGAYKPLKNVIGWAEKQEGYRCIDFGLVDIPF